MYKVIKYFTDLHDNNHPYHVGDAFPRDGIAVTEGRLAELAGSENKQGVPLIEPVEETVQTEEETAEYQETVDDTELAAKKPPTKKQTAKKTAPVE